MVTPRRNESERTCADRKNGKTDMIKKENRFISHTYCIVQLLCLSKLAQLLIYPGNNIVVAGRIVIPQTLQILTGLESLAPFFINVGHKQECPSQPIIVGSTFVDKSIQRLFGRIDRFVVELILGQ